MLCVLREDSSGYISQVNVSDRSVSQKARKPESQKAGKPESRKAGKTVSQKAYLGMYPHSEPIMTRLPIYHTGVPANQLDLELKVPELSTQQLINVLF